MNSEISHNLQNLTANIIINTLNMQAPPITATAQLSCFIIILSFITSMCHICNS